MGDPTTTAVQRQIAAMGSQVFEVGVFDPTVTNDKGEVEGRMLLRTYDTNTLLKSVLWLRSQNAKGNHIYIRPHGEHSLTLVDDLTAAAVKQMKSDGYAPALVVETSPKNFQAWLQHGQVLPKDQSTTAARLCAEKFGGDLGSADWRHFGRLAGFTNRKPKYQQDNGYFPFVKLIEASGHGYPATGELLAEATKLIAKEKVAAEQRKQALLAKPQVTTQAGQLKSIDAFRTDPRYSADQTRADLAYATYALAHHVSPAKVYDDLASRDLSHKGSQARQAAYIERTMTKALAEIKGPAR
jgi:hypothetical protein